MGRVQGTQPSLGIGPSTGVSGGRGVRTKNEAVQDLPTRTLSTSRRDS